KWKKWKQIVAILVIIFTISGLSVFADNNDTTPEVTGESQTGKDNTITSPEVTEPEVTKPEVTKPEVTEPEVTEPVKKTPETKDKKQAAKPRAVETVQDIFPDGGLAEVVRAALNKNNVTDVVTQAELDSIQDLDANSKGITNLTGIERLNDLKVLRVDNNQIVDFSMVDWGKIVSVYARNQLINLTLDIDWSEKVTIDPGEQLFKKPMISDPSYAINLRNDVWFTDFPAGDSFYDGLDIVELPGKMVVEGFENVDQTFNFEYRFYRDSMSNPAQYSRFMYNSEFKVKLNQVSKKVTFDNEGIESSNQIPVTDLIKEPTTPTKQGYAFLGWYDARSGGTKWDFVTDKMPNVLIFLIYLQKYWDFFQTVLYYNMSTKNKLVKLKNVYYLIYLF
ncbi:hypothetical protein FL865_15455, partial [Listeria monocytogenes]|nr:hypothetical protein [Listeria monocytogenes]